MASINNVQIKAIVSFIGNEGHAFQGNIYIDGKKAGFWSQDGDGGCDRFDFNTSVLEKRAREYYSKHLPVDTMALYKTNIKDYDPDNLPRKFPGEEWILDMFMGELLDLTLDEKDYKANVRKGYPLTVRMEGYYVRGIPTMIPTIYGVQSREVAMKLLKEKQCKNQTAHIIIYEKLENFCITV